MDQATLSELQTLKQLADAGVIDGDSAKRMQEEAIRDSAMRRDEQIRLEQGLPLAQAGVATGNLPKSFGAGATFSIGGSFGAQQPQAPQALLSAPAPLALPAGPSPAQLAAERQMQALQAQQQQMQAQMAQQMAAAQQALAAAATPTPAPTRTPEPAAVPAPVAAPAAAASPEKTKSTSSGDKPEQQQQLQLQKKKSAAEKQSTDLDSKTKSGGAAGGTEKRVRAPPSAGLPTGCSPLPACLLTTIPCRRSW